MVGVPRNPTEFMAAAQKAGHRRGHLVRTLADVAKAIEATWNGLNTGF